MTSRSAPGVVVRLRLRPGLSAVPRSPGVLQVGLDPPRRALVPDHPDVRRLLAGLDDGRPVRVAGPVATAALAALHEADLVAPAADPPPDLPPALLARHGERAASRVRARGRARVLLDATGPWREDAEGLLAGAGLGTTGDPAAASVALVLAERDLARERADVWVRDGVPHLCLAVHEGGVTLGPLVVPGTTACLRCVDAHLGEHDPRRPIVLDQLARRPGPAPLEDLTARLAVAWAVRELVLHVEGERPVTWSATVDIDTAGSSPTPTPRPWPRHPHCGCAWDSWPARLRSVDAREH